MKSRSMSDDSMIFHLTSSKFNADVHSSCSIIDRIHTIVNEDVYLHLLSHDKFDNLDNKESEKRNLLIYPWQQEDKWSILIKNNIISQHFYSRSLSLSLSLSFSYFLSFIGFSSCCLSNIDVFSSSFFFLCLFGSKQRAKTKKKTTKRHVC